LWHFLLAQVFAFVNRCCDLGARLGLCQLAAQPGSVSRRPVEAMKG
jgi:hypothetical protein